MSISKPAHGSTGWDSNINSVIDQTNILTLSAAAVKTGNYTAAAGEVVPVDLSGGGFTVTLPTAPADGSTVTVIVVTASTSGALCTVTRGGSDVLQKAGGATSTTLRSADESVTFRYAASTAVWHMVAQGQRLVTTVRAFGMDAANPPAGLAAVSATATPTANAAALAAQLAYVKASWGSGRVVLPSGMSIPCGPLGTLPATVQLHALEQTTLDMTSLTDGQTGLSVNDTDFTPLVGVKMVGPGKAVSATALNITGQGMTFDRPNIRYWGTGVNLANSNTYINRFTGFAIGECGLCVNQDFFDAGATNAGERTVFEGGVFFNSDQIFNVQSNQGGLFVTNCSLDYCADYGLMNDSHIIFTGCHIESNFSATPNGYMFNPGYQTRLAFSNCNFILSAAGGEGLRFIIKPSSGPSVYTKGRVLWDNCLAFFVDTSHTGQQRFSEEFLYVDGPASSVSFETPFVSNWGPVTAQPGQNSGDPQVQATASVSMGFSSGAPTGTVTVTLPVAVSPGTGQAVRVKF